MCVPGACAQVLVSLMEDEDQAPAQRVNAAMAVALLVGHEEDGGGADLMVLNTQLMEVGLWGAPNGGGTDLMVLNTQLMEVGLWGAPNGGGARPRGAQHPAHGGRALGRTLALGLRRWWPDALCLCEVACV